MNAIKTVLLLGLLSGILLVAGEVLGGRQGLYIGLTMAIVMNFASYFFSDKIALAMYSAQPVTESQNAEVYRRIAPLVQNLCHKMSLPMPRSFNPSSKPRASGARPLAWKNGMILWRRSSAAALT